mmetsp:Transcript_24194/g.38365  ORF Transcript_24194/g.38365 Transcript_24194/m.38365 type:complete len:319 (+) Transcript_24194:46-1002(+)
MFSVSVLALTMRCAVSMRIAHFVELQIVLNNISQKLVQWLIVHHFAVRETIIYRDQPDQQVALIATQIQPIEDLHKSARVRETRFVVIVKPNGDPRATQYFAKDDQQHDGARPHDDEYHQDTENDGKFAEVLTARIAMVHIERNIIVQVHGDEGRENERADHDGNHRAHDALPDPDGRQQRQMVALLTLIAVRIVIVVDGIRHKEDPHKDEVQREEVAHRAQPVEEEGGDVERAAEHQRLAADRDERDQDGDERQHVVIVRVRRSAVLVVIHDHGDALQDGLRERFEDGLQNKASVVDQFLGKVFLQFGDAQLLGLFF